MPETGVEATTGKTVIFDTSPLLLIPRYPEVVSASWNGHNRVLHTCRMGIAMIEPARSGIYNRPLV